MYCNKSVLVIVQARMGSTRLPGKVLKDLAGIPVLSHVVNRLATSTIIDKVVVATSVEAADDAIEQWGRSRGTAVFRGSEEDVLSRYYDCLQRYPADIICRVTADCPLVDYHLIESAIGMLYDGKYDYVSMDNDLIPRGVHGEVFTAQVLRDVAKKATKKHQREHVTYYIYEENGDNFNWTYLRPPSWLIRNYRLTLDTELDYRLLVTLFSELYSPGKYLELKQVLEHLDEHPQLAAINGAVCQKPVEL